MKKILLLLLFSFLSLNLFSEGLFDSVVSDSQQENENTAKPASARESTVDFSGSAKALADCSVNNEEENLSVSGSFSEFRGEISASPSESIKAFSEIIATGSPEENGNNLEVREAYIDIYGNSFDFSAGQKIIVWGRADAVNPTNRITPVRNSSVSSSEDDRRLGNLLAEIKYSPYPFTFTAIWVPLYRQSELPSFIQSTLSDPDPVMENSSFAFKTDYESSSFDFSVSYFNGYNPSPGISDLKGSGNMELKPYRIHNIGLDFSTTVSDYGIRGETAFLIPFSDHEKIYVPSPEISYIAGIDRSMGDLTLILQYSGKYITDFIEKEDLAGLNPVEAELENMNRIISSQAEKVTHSAVFRVSLDLFHETLSLETAGSWNFTTEELFIKPLAVWDAADSLTVSGGAFLYAGPDGTLFGMLEDRGSSVFAEVKLCF